jgi:uncharacterized repeat protein (TIGR01451 family)
MGRISRLWLVPCALIGALAACGGDGDDYKVPSGSQDGGIDAPHRDAGGDSPGGGDASMTGADLSVAITASPSPVAASATLTYAIVVHNAGGLTASGLTLTHTLPSGDVAFGTATGIGWTCAAAGQVVTCTRSSLIVGDAPTVNVTVTTPATGATLSSTVSITSHTGDDDLSNNSATVSTTVLTPSDLSLAMTESPNPVAAGGTVTYSLAVTNHGPGASSGVSVTDTVPTGATFVSASGTDWSCNAAGGIVTCTNATIADGATSTIALLLTAPTQGGTLVNSATVTAMTPDPSATNNAASTSTTVNAAGDLAIAVSSTPNPVLVNGTLSYAIDVNNIGPDDASGVTVTDQLPAGNVTFVSATGSGWTCAASGQVVTCTRASLLVGAAPTITIKVTSADATTLTDSATVTSTSSDPVLSNNTGSTMTTVTPAADLSISMTDTPDPVSTSGTLTYAINVQNAGPSTADSITVTDTLPTGTTFQSASGTNWICGETGTTVSCTTTSVSTGSSLPAISIVVTVPANAQTLSNTASVSAATIDPVPSNNTVSATTTINAPANLQLVLADSPDPVAANSTLTYTIDINNAGPSDAANLVVTDRLPDGNVSFISATGIGWTCSQSGQIVTCTRPLLIVGAAPTITIKVTTPASFTTLVDTASVTSSTADTDTSDNSATQSTNGATPLADLSVTLTDTPDPVQGSTTAGCTTNDCVLYQIQVHNAGPAAATGISVVIQLPASGSFVSVIGSGWVCPAPSGTITCTLSSGIASGDDSTVINFNWKAPSPGGFSIVAKATVSSTSSDPDLSNNSVSNDTTVDP